MSFDALSWAAKQAPGSSGAKLVLLGLAECADRSHGLAFPSIAALVEFCCLDRKSVIANLDKLEAGGFITDTGRKVGQTKQIKVYQLNLESVPKAEPSQKRNSSGISGNSPKNGTRNLSEPSEAKASSLRVMDCWDLMAGKAGLSPIRWREDASQAQSLRLRLKNPGEAALIEAIGLLGANPWLRGEGRDSKWRPNFAWLLKPANLRKVLEKTYGHDEPTQPRLSPADELARLDGLAIWFRDHDRPDAAADTMRKADRLRASLAGEPSQVGAVALRIVGGMAAQ